MKIAFTIVFALALSMLAVLSGIATAYKSTLPSVAISLFPWSGFAYASAANRELASLAASPSDQRSQEQLASIKKSARHAFILEPLAVNAITALGLVADYSNDRQKARKMMRNAALLTKRNIAANLWLIRDFGSLNNIDKVLTLSDQALRTSAHAQTVLFPALWQSLEYGTNIEPMVGILSKNPPWAREFWVLAKDHPKSYLNAALVRQKLHRAKMRQEPQFDQNLIAYLIDAGQFGPAEKLFLEASTNSYGRETDLVRNGDFLIIPDLVPFAWETFFDSYVNSEIDSQSGQLVITVFPNGSGMIARQMLNLPTGQYALNAKLNQFQSDFSNVLYIKLQCADSNESVNAAIRININTAKVSRVFENDSDCNWFWLSIWARPSASSESMVFRLREVGIDREL